MTEPKTINYLHRLQDRTDDLRRAHSEEIDVSVLGAPLIIEQSASTAMGDLKHMDAIVLPL